MTKLLAAIFAAISTGQAQAAAAVGGMAALAADVGNADKWPWIVSVFGAVVVMTKLKEQSRMQGFANGITSVMLGGLGSSFVSEWLHATTGLAPGQLLVAFLLSALWPVAVSVLQQLWPLLHKRLEKKIAGGQP